MVQVMSWSGVVYRDKRLWGDAVALRLLKRNRRDATLERPKLKNFKSGRDSGINLDIA
jgi:hypothetical protein